MGAVFSFVTGYVDPDSGKTIGVQTDSLTYPDSDFLQVPVASNEQPENNSDIDIAFADISVLSSRIDHLRQGLAQAAAFIQETSITLDKYVQLLERSERSQAYLMSK